ncbi:lipocalin family protein [Hyunsoonleella sp. SJ7]|uniref:Lipocalin family protein n=1 Tax=Hyunsoonleella aquatilis TaxID=2762758 RepID=A0A923HAK3_9FLAO|nr:lipocalin family protein [Hyunsoonleella aquatilis]MBC3759880.1 lipocalin family protein [Hyunsoonleella aquatilis]
MKRLLLSLTIIALTSCRSDDDSAVQTDDSFIIGSWTLSKSLLDGNERNIDDCIKRSNFIFKSDGNYTESIYFTERDGPCELDIEKLGIWENLGKKTVRLKYTPNPAGGTPYEEDIIINGNTFSIYYDTPYISIYKKN